MNSAVSCVVCGTVVSPWASSVTGCMLALHVRPSGTLSGRAVHCMVSQRWQRHQQQQHGQQSIIQVRTTSSEAFLRSFLCSLMSYMVAVIVSVTAGVASIVAGNTASCVSMKALCSRSMHWQQALGLPMPQRWRARPRTCLCVWILSSQVDIT